MTGKAEQIRRDIMEAAQELHVKGWYPGRAAAGNADEPGAWVAGSEKTLSDVARDIWRARLAVCLGAMAGLAAAALFIALAVPHYRASLLVAPSNPMNGAEVSSLLADDSLFALRYLVQRVGVANSSDFLRFENTYAGPSVAAYLLKDGKVRDGLARDRAFILSKSEKDWNAEKLAAYLAKRVEAQPVGGTTLRRLVYEHPDPAFAQYFLGLIHRAGDGLIRQSIRREAEGRIRYLGEAIAETVNPEHRRALTTLLLEQERLKMLVSLEQSYAASVIEPASAGPKPAWPDRTLLFAALVFAGAFTGFVAHGLRRAA